MLDAAELQALLGPTVRVSTEQGLKDTFYVLSSSGDVYAYSAGHRKEVPNSLKAQVKKNHFPEPEQTTVAAPKVVTRPTTINDLDYETQQRYHRCADIIAGLVPSATREDRRLASNFVGLVLERLHKNSSG